MKKGMQALDETSRKREKFAGSVGSLSWKKNERDGAVCKTLGCFSGERGG